MTASHSRLNLCEKVDESSIDFDCSICLELPHDPVVTVCGHLFCWSCLHQWITIQPVFQECPVCKACVKDKIIPLYGRGRVGRASKMNHSFKTPPRPSHQQSYIPPASNMPRSTGFRLQSIISQQTIGNRGRHSMHSMTASDLLPALFGIHMIASPEYNGAFSALSRSPAVGLIAQHEPVLYWILFLLGCSASVCSLFFL